MAVVVVMGVHVYRYMCVKFSSKTIILYGTKI